MQRGKNMDHDRERERGMRHGSGSGSECLPNSTLFLSTRDEIANDVSAAPVPNMEHFHFGWWNLVTSQADHRSDLTDTLLGVGSNFGNSNEYRAGRSIICKVLKTRIWVVPPVCLGSR